MNVNIHEPNPTPTAPALTPAPSPPAPTPEVDPFVQAVRLAEQAAEDGKAADTRAEWLALASHWQRASDLMATVPPEDPRYPTAQDRVQAYQANSEAALGEAQKF